MKIPKKYFEPVPVGTWSQRETFREAARALRIEAKVARKAKAGREYINAILSAASSFDMLAEGFSWVRAFDWAHAEPPQAGKPGDSDAR